MNAAHSGASARPARLAVGVLGAGRVGAVLGAALARVGHTVVAASGVSRASRERAADLLGLGETVDPYAVAVAADLLLVAVPDDVLEGLVEGLAEADVLRTGTLVAHTSGRFGTAVLEPLTRRGALPLALHPAMTFTGTRVDLARLDGASFGITAPEPLRPVAEALVLEMGSEPQWVAEEHRVLYHAALANGSNHLVTLVAQSMDLLRTAGVEHPARLLGPLLGASLDNALRAGDAALTGPVARGDAGTVAEHVGAIAGQSPQAAAAYVAMARLTADRALAAGRLNPSDAERLLGALGGAHPFQARPAGEGGDR
ncbi:MAG: Rossmann-like and DUF2520 domain-containing protein [Sporichthyaceae bacterium]